MGMMPYYCRIPHKFESGDQLSHNRSNREQVLAAVRGYGLEGYLDGTLPPPERVSVNDNNQKIINPEFLAWTRQDQLLMSWILSSLSESILVCCWIREFQSVWEALDISFAYQNGAKIMQYKLQLQTLKKGTLSMRDYLNKIKSVCDLLASPGHGIDEPIKSRMPYPDLGTNITLIIVSITSRVEPCSLREAHAILLSYENRLEVSDNMSSAENFSVNLTTQSPSPGFRRGTPQNLRGRNTNQFQGYRGRGAGRNGNYRGRGGRFGNGPRCQICHYMGHMADKCFYRTNLNFVPGNGRGNYFQPQSQAPNVNSGYANLINQSPAVNIATNDNTTLETEFSPAASPGSPGTESHPTSSSSSSSMIPIAGGRLTIDLPIEHDHNSDPCHCRDSNPSLFIEE
ncbi:hypothetical protein DH2020_046477 [Rehmannia glutinosa]|uniref:Retrotransposon gag domain-containing protein n=1 Tax=Rehmannia glutinosa TaxID=99300 RepID=A0ABR0UB56_REHGL